MGKHALKARPKRRSRMHRFCGVKYVATMFYQDGMLTDTIYNPCGYEMRLVYSGPGANKRRRIDVNQGDYHV